MDVGVRHVHPNYAFLAEGLHMVFRFDQWPKVGIASHIAHLVNWADLFFILQRNPDSLDSDIFPLQLAFPNVCKSATRNDSLLDLTACECTNKVAFWNLA